MKKVKVFKALLWKWRCPNCGKDSEPFALHADAYGSAYWHAYMEWRSEMREKYSDEIRGAYGIRVPIARLLDNISKPEGFVEVADYLSREDTSYYWGAKKTEGYLENKGGY